MISIRVSPEEQAQQTNTHHIAISDRFRKLGFVLCDDKGNPRLGPDSFNEIPVETTAQKQTSGNSSYTDYDYPYSPIVQDDLSGGRGNIDFERDSTKYFDSYRAKTGRANKAYAGPKETYPTGLRTQIQNMPGSTKWITMTGNYRTIYYRFQVGATSLTTALAWARVRRRGTPGQLYVSIWADAAGSLDTTTLIGSSTFLHNSHVNDILAEWVTFEIARTLTAGTFYWLVVRADQVSDDAQNHWKIAVKPTAGNSYYHASVSGNPTPAGFDLYFRLTQSQTTERSCIGFEYLEQQYFVVSGTSGAPTLHAAGDRGSADSNAGTLDRLIDATKAWAVNSNAGKIIMIVDGTGIAEKQTWRTIVSNTAQQNIVDTPWTIQHDTTTTYVILGDEISEITGHGLTAPVTDVLVHPNGFVMFAQGDGVNIRRMREFNNAGVWTLQFEDDGTNKATFLEYAPRENKIVKANNSDAAGDVTVAKADPAAWGAAHAFAAAVKVDNQFRKINGMAIYPDTVGQEAVYVFKSDIIIIVPQAGTPYAVTLPEMRTIRGNNNGVVSATNGPNLYFTMQQGLQRFFGGQFDSVGPDQGEGMPSNRRGPITGLATYPGKLFASIDAGASGYSSIVDSDGWHERYRAPKAMRIRSISYQPMPGTGLSRLWLYQGNDLVYLPFPSASVNELEEPTYPYTDEFAVVLSRMHAGMYDVQKMIKRIKLQTDELETDELTNEPITWFELDYRTDENEEWISFEERFTTSPTQSIDLSHQLGLAANRLQFRIRGYSTDQYKSPVFLAIIVSAVLRVDVKNMYPLQFRVIDNEPMMRSSTDADPTPAAQKLQIIRDWADASTDHMLKIEAITPLLHNKIIFLNPPQIRQIQFRGEDNQPNDGYVVNVSVQEA